MNRRASGATFVAAQNNSTWANNGIVFFRLAEATTAGREPCKPDCRSSIQNEQCK
jgi:hypothetical protein